MEVPKSYFEKIIDEMKEAKGVHYDTELDANDLKELAEKFKDLDTIVETAREVNEASGGKCKLFSGYDEIKRSLTGSRTQGFYDENDKITIDDNIKTYMETAKTLYDEDLPSIPISGVLTGVQI